VNTQKRFVRFIVNKKTFCYSYESIYIRCMAVSATNLPGSIQLKIECCVSIPKSEIDGTELCVLFS
jgi:hypothetical protein